MQALQHLPILHLRKVIVKITDGIERVGHVEDDQLIEQTAGFLNGGLGGQRVSRRSLAAEIFPG